MVEPIKLFYQVDGDDFAAAGGASSDVKRTLKQLGITADIIRRVVVCMYEGEINMVLHANGGRAEIEIDEKKVRISLKDRGPGIADVELAMKEGYSTAGENARNLGFGAGMGLPNMKKYSDEMDIKTKVGEGTTVSMTVYLESKKKV